MLVLEYMFRIELVSKISYVKLYRQCVLSVLCRNDAGDSTVVSWMKKLCVLYVFEEDVNTHVRLASTAYQSN